MKNFFISLIFKNFSFHQPPNVLTILKNGAGKEIQLYTNWFLPRITPVFYHECAACVNDADNTAMRVMGVLAFANIHQE